MSPDPLQQALISLLNQPDIDKGVLRQILTSNIKIWKAKQELNEVNQKIIEEAEKLLDQIK